MQNVKKFLSAEPELRECAIFWAKMGPFPQMNFFFGNPVNEYFFFEPSLFMSTYMPKIKARYYSISNILMIK